MNHRIFEKYDPSATYVASSEQHAPTVGQIGHGAIVKFADGETGTVIASNTERALVHYSGACEWFRNDLLMVEARFIA